MKQEMIVISKSNVELMLKQLTRAEYYCAHAKSTADPSVDVMDDATSTYPGATGYAGATMRDVISTLECAVELNRITES